MNAFLRRRRTAAMLFTAAVATGASLAFSAPVMANQQCEAGPLPILSNTNCQGDSAAHAGGADSSSSSSSSGSSGANNGGGGGNSGTGAGGNSGAQ